MLTFTVVKTSTWNYVTGKLAEGNMVQIFNTRQLVVAHDCNPNSVLVQPARSIAAGLRPDRPSFKEHVIANKNTSVTLYVCDPSTWEPVAGLHEFKLRLGYMQ